MWSFPRIESCVALEWRPFCWGRPSFWLWLTWCRAGRKNVTVPGWPASFRAHGRLPRNRPGKPRLDSGRPSRQNERKADRPAGALHAVPHLYLMFGWKKTEPVKPKPKLDKSGIWYDSIMFQGIIYMGVRHPCLLLALLHCLPRLALACCLRNAREQSRAGFSRLQTTFPAALLPRLPPWRQYYTRHSRPR